MLLNNASFLNNISFGSIKAEKRVCEDILRQYHQKYPQEFQSNTKVNTKINKIWNYSLLSLSKYTNLSSRQEQAVRMARKEYGGRTYQNWEDYIASLKKACLKHKAANCGEQNLLLADEFFKKGIEVHTIKVEYDKKLVHTFLVTNAKENADWSDPKTWGNKAIVVDAWSNVVLQAKDAIEYFKKLFQFDPRVHTEKFFSKDLINVKEYLKKMKQ